MIPSEIIEEIRNKADIVNVVSEFVKIKKRGKNYVGLCPFHSEKDGSFTVSPEKQLWHCFGCGEGGNVFAFLMRIENIGFAEAVEELGAKLGIAVPAQRKGGPTRGQKDQLYQIMLLATKFFQHSLESEAGKAAREYLKDRGISDKTREIFNLGYAPPAWDDLFKNLIGRGVAPELIEKTGLILKREGKGGYYDRFRNRLLFPISDQRNRVIAFGGRALGDQEPKYLNSPDSSIYHKGETLFGLNLAKDAIKQEKCAILVEGNFDLVTPFQAGVTNIVATCGTALTGAQCKLLARYCDTIVLAFDADSAGGVAAERSVELMRNEGLKVRIALLTGGKDPDEVVRKQGKDGFRKCLEQAFPYHEFKFRRIVKRHNINEIESKAKALKEAAQVLSREKDEFVRKEYAKLAATILKTDLDTVLAEVKRHYQYAPGARFSSRRVPEKPGSKIEEAEKNLIAIAAQDKSALTTVREQMVVGDFGLPETRVIAELLITAEIKEKDDPAHFLLNNLPDEGAKKLLSRLLLSEYLSRPDKKEEILHDCIKVIKRARLKQKIDSLKLEIKEAEKSGETERVAELLSVLKSEIS
jgi:DNA primase